MKINVSPLGRKSPHVLGDVSPLGRRLFTAKMRHFGIRPKAILLFIILFCIFSVFCKTAFSQDNRNLNEIEKTAFGQKMQEQSKKIKTLQCSFVQEKTSTLVKEKAVAKGILLYQSSSMLRWEYTYPTPSTLILNRKNAVLLDANGKQQGNVNLLKQLGNIIISMINGESLRQNKQFSTEVFEGENDFTVILTPLQKRLKEYYKTIELKLDKNAFLASEVVMNEKSGDRTVIFFNDKELNIEIDPNKFIVK
jgi:outer membrane lipoprotein-sorting protein